jgi:hypothetical protein
MGTASLWTSWRQWAMQQERRTLYDMSDYINQQRGMALGMA